MTTRKRDAQAEPVEEGKYHVQVTLTVAAAGNYSAGNIMSNSATDGAGVATKIELGEVFAVKRIRQIITKCDEDSVTFIPRYHFYDQEPAAADVEMDDRTAGDFAKTATGRAAYLCSILGGAFVDRGTAMAVSETDLIDKLVRTASGKSAIWLVLEDTTGETNETAGMTFTIDIYFD